MFMGKSRHQMPALQTLVIQYFGSSYSSDAGCNKPWIEVIAASKNHILSTYGMTIYQDTSPH
jgi:hypothetical protein